MRALFKKLPGGYLEPVGEDAEQFAASLKVGQGMWVDVTKCRNPRFHNKVLKLIRIGYEHWNPDAAPDVERIDGIVPMKDFESFRKKILILAGHCDAFYDLDGRVSFEAKSIAFANCGELEFQKIYKNILDVVWERVMQHCKYRTPEELDNVVNELLSFAG